MLTIFTGFPRNDFGGECPYPDVMSHIPGGGRPPIPIQVLPRETEAQVELARTSLRVSWKSVLVVIALISSFILALYLLG